MKEIAMLTRFFKTIPLVSKALSWSSQLSCHIYNFRGTIIAWFYFFEQCCFNNPFISSLLLTSHTLEPLVVLFQARWSWSVYPVEVLVGYQVWQSRSRCVRTALRCPTTPPTGQTRTFDYMHRCTDLYSTWFYYRILLTVSWNYIICCLHYVSVSFCNQIN